MLRDLSITVGWAIGGSLSYLLGYWQGKRWERRKAAERHLRFLAQLPIRYGGGREPQIYRPYFPDGE